MKRSYAFFISSQIILDMTFSLAAFYFAYELTLLSPHRGLNAFDTYLPEITVFLFVIFIVFAASHLYRHQRSSAMLDEIYNVSKAITMAMLLTIAIVTLFLPNKFTYQRRMIGYAWALAIVFVSLSRWLHASLQASLQARSIGADRVLIIGSGEVGRMILQKITHTPSLGYKVIGFVTTNGKLVPGTIMGVPVLGHRADLPQLIEQHKIDEVIIAWPEATHQETVGLVALCDQKKVGIKVFPDLFQIMASEVTIGDLGGLPLLTIRDIALRGWRIAVKRTMDILFSGIALILFSPIMLLVAIAIKLESPGPVFYVQERMGLDAKPFPTLKFRSMRVDAEQNGPGWTTFNDTRRTRVGAFIRRYSIDELPQLINILLGDMSLVGPRPERPVYVNQFRQSIPRYMDRHREKAGLTGWAQVNGLRGDTSIAERTKYDLWYIENWSISLDIKIILRTVLSVFTDRNAY